ncbi:MAG: M23 family metallopeptidase [Balneolales bacterium]|nr:M23 family metallopeptidase [Balneolales bacterium]
MMIMVGLASCKQPPKEQFAQFDPIIEISKNADSLSVSLKNTIAAPLQFSATSQNAVLMGLLTDSFPFVLSAYADTSLIFISNDLPDSPKISFGILFGDPDAPFIPPVLELPFTKGKSYKILQGYYGEFSHNTTFSRYALDFDMAIGDTVLAAADGIVVGLIQDYKYGGSSRKWRDFANLITLYHPNSGAFTQYVHLDHKGSLVALGDTVAVGQPIGLSGNTGFSTVPHLHFNVLRPLHGEVVSTPVASIGSYRGEELTRGSIAWY